MDERTNRKRINPYLQAMEELNCQNMDLIESAEYIEGQKVLNRKKIIKNHQVMKKLGDFLRHKKAQSVEQYAKENFDDTTWRQYLHLGDPDIKVVVYSCITGGYDDFKEPLFKGSNTQYVMYTDKENKRDNSGWCFYNIPEIGLFDNNYINRYIKMHPFELFASEYDYSIYIDGNVQAVSDLSVLPEMLQSESGFSVHRHRYRDCIYEEEQVCEWKGKGNIQKMKSQVKRYREEGFPAHFGLGECTVIVTDLKSSNAKMIYQKWWEEYLSSGSYRDQLCLPYVIWKLGMKMDSICTLGNNLYRNKKIRVYSH